MPNKHEKRLQETKRVVEEQKRRREQRATQRYTPNTDEQVMKAVGGAVSGGSILGGGWSIQRKRKTVMGRS